MKTAAQHAKEIADWFGDINENDLARFLNRIMLGSYRAGMEQAAKRCEEQGDAICDSRLPGSELSDAEVERAEGCYICASRLAIAAKTAQLPT